MYTVKQYTKDTLALTNSIVIKISAIATVINTNLLYKYNIVAGEDKYTWKYYMNLSGEKHETNNDIYISVIESGTTELLTKQLLIDNEYTRNELNKYASTYRELTNNYPDDIDYIKGCINPVPIDRAIEAKDGDVLTYSSYYVEHQEVSIIRELDLAMSGFISRWYISNYTITDELYLSALIGMMYSTIPSTIINLRLNKVYSNEAHSFHLEHFFRSRLGLWEELSYLSNDIKIWLYNNLNYITHNIGKNSTFELVVKKVFEANNVGVGVYTLINSEPTLKLTSTLLESVYDKPDNVYSLNKLNNKYGLTDKEVVTIDTLTNLQLFNNPDLEITTNKDSYNTTNEYIKDKVSSISTINQNTKTLDVDNGVLFRLYGNDLLNSTLDQWLYLASTGKYTTIRKFIDPNTKKEYNLTPLDGIYLFFYMLMEISGDITIPVTDIKYNWVIDDTVTKASLTNNFFNVEMTNVIADMMLDKLPKELSIYIKSSDLGDSISSLIDLYTSVWVLDSNINNSSISSNIKHMVSRVYKSGTHTVPGSDGIKTLSDILVSKDIIIDVNANYNVMDTVTELFKLYTNRDMNEFLELEKSLDAMIRLLNKLTSYTVQVIKSVNDKDSMYAPYSTIEALYADTGIITVTDASILHQLEINNVTIYGEGNDFREKLDGYTLGTYPTGTLCGEILTYLTVDTPRELEVRIESPTVFVEIVNTCPTMWSPTITSEGVVFKDNTNSILYNTTTPEGYITPITTTYLDTGTAAELTATIEPTSTSEIVKVIPIMWSPTITSEGVVFKDNTTGILYNTTTPEGYVTPKLTTYLDTGTAAELTATIEPTSTSEIVKVVPVMWYPTIVAGGNNITNTNTISSTISGVLTTLTTVTDINTLNIVAYSTDPTNINNVVPVINPNVVVTIT